eukprot:scaffold42536_cov45-Prasinocladus_malaysianus.AAC.1
MAAANAEGTKSSLAIPKPLRGPDKDAGKGPRSQGTWVTNAGNPNRLQHLSCMGIRLPQSGANSTFTVRQDFSPAKERRIHRQTDRHNHCASSSQQVVQPCATMSSSWSRVAVIHVAASFAQVA